MPAERYWLPFEEARDYVRALDLPNVQAFHEWVQSDERLERIPTQPRDVYRSEWVDWYDWLGKKKGETPWLPFDEARAYVRALEFPSRVVFLKWTKSNERHTGIPTNPEYVYRSDWVSWFDWLGKSGTYCRTDWASRRLPFEEARDYVRRLNLSNVAAFRKWCKSSDRHKGIPTSPHVVYPSEWVNWNDWLGKPQPMRCACGYLISANSRKARKKHGILVINRRNKKRRS